MNWRLWVYLQTTPLFWLTATLGAFLVADRLSIAARRHPDGKGGWFALPAMSASLALVARIAARGDAACRSFERGWRDCWAGLARQAPDLAGIDLVLAEALIAGADRARLAEETA